MSQSQPSTRRLARRVSWETILALLVLIAVIGGTLLNKDFLTVENWSNLLANFVEIALMALPLSLIVITNEIDLSVASMLGLSSSLLGLLWEYKLAMPLAIVICLAVGALCGALNGFLIVRFRLPSLAVTIGTLALFRGFAYIVLGDKAVADYPPEYAEFGIGVIPYTFIPIAVRAVHRLGADFLGPASSHHRWPQSLRDRGQSNGGAFFRSQHQPVEDAAVYRFRRDQRSGWNRFHLSVFQFASG